MANIRRPIRRNLDSDLVEAEREDAENIEMSKQCGFRNEKYSTNAGKGSREVFNSHQDTEIRSMTKQFKSMDVSKSSSVRDDGNKKDYQDWNDNYTCIHSYTSRRGIKRKPI